MPSPLDGKVASFCTCFRCRQRNTYNDPIDLLYLPADQALRKVKEIRELVSCVNKVTPPKRANRFARILKESGT